MMNTNSSTRHIARPDGSGAPSVLSRQAVRLALLGLSVMVAAGGLFAVAYAIGGADATSDNWVGILVVLLGAVGFLSALAAFVQAVRGWMAGARWSVLWPALTVMPLALTFLVLGEAFWWE